jgi:hypothetical protein
MSGTATERPVVARSRPHPVPVVSVGVLAPVRPAEDAVTLEHLDFDAEVGCEVDWFADGVLCGSTPVTHRIYGGCPCVLLSCARHARLLVAYWARNVGRLAYCETCGQPVRTEDCRAVPL